MPYRETFGNPWCPCGQILQQCLAEYCRRLYEVGLQAAPARNRESAERRESTQLRVSPHAATLSVCDGSALQEDKTESSKSPNHNTLKAWQHAERLAVECSRDRQSTRLNSSHDQISYAVF